MTRVDIPKATKVYSRLNDAYTRMVKGVLSSDDRKVIACFLRLHGDRASDMIMMDYWYDKAHELVTGKIITDFDLEIVKNIVFAALTAACNVLRKSGVEVNDDEEVVA